MLIVSNLTLTHGFMVIARHQTKGKGRNSNQVRSVLSSASLGLLANVFVSFSVAESPRVCYVFTAIAHSYEQQPGTEVANRTASGCGSRRLGHSLHSWL